MRSPDASSRTRFSLKASHRRLTLGVSHRRGDPESKGAGIKHEQDRPRYIAPPRPRPRS